MRIEIDGDIYAPDELFLVARDYFQVGPSYITVALTFSTEPQEVDAIYPTGSLVTFVSNSEEAWALLGTDSVEVIDDGKTTSWLGELVAEYLEDEEVV